MRYIDSIYDAYSPAAAAALSPSSTPSSLRRTRGISNYFSQSYSPESPSAAASADSPSGSTFYKQPISPLKAINLGGDDDEVEEGFGKLGILQSNRSERRQQSSTLPLHQNGRQQQQLQGNSRNSSWWGNRALKVMFCGLERSIWRILVICLVAAFTAVIITVVLVAGGIGASAPRVEVLKGTTLRPLPKHKSLITLTENRLIFDGILQLKPKISNPNAREMLIDSLVIHGYYVVKGTAKSEWRKNYIASGSTELITVPRKGSVVANVAMDVRYSSPRPNSAIMKDLLGRIGKNTRKEVPSRIELMYQFEVGYRVGKRLRKVTFSGKQAINSPFTAEDIAAIRENEPQAR